MNVREVIEALVDRHYSTQQALADALNPMPDGIEPVKQADVQRLLHAGRNIEKQYALFQKITALAREEGLIL